MTIFHSRIKRNKKETKITKDLNFSPVTIFVHFVTFCKNLFLQPRWRITGTEGNEENKVFSNSSNCVSFISF